MPYKCFQRYSFGMGDPLQTRQEGPRQRCHTTVLSEIAAHLSVPSAPALSPGPCRHTCEIQHARVGDSKARFLGGRAGGQAEPIQSARDPSRERSQATARYPGAGDLVPSQAMGGQRVAILRRSGYAKRREGQAEQCRIRQDK